MAVCRENLNKTLSSVGVPKRNEDTFGRDADEMIASKQTFDNRVISSEVTLRDLSAVAFSRNLFGIWAILPSDPNLPIDRWAMYLARGLVTAVAIVMCSSIR